MNIEAQQLGLSFGRSEILKSLDVTLRKGQFTGILGPSGSGKSTLLNVLAGRLRPSTGKVLYDGRELVGRPGLAVGFVPQDDTLHLPLRTERLLYYTAKLQQPGQSGKDLKTKVAQVLASVDLKERARLPVRRLSGGQRKRVSIAMELLQSPEVLMLDEPTSGLDPELEKQIMNLCARLAKEGRTVAMTTHILDSIRLFDQLIFVVGGQLAFAGSPQRALDFFQVDGMHYVYAALASSRPETLASKFRSYRARNAGRA